MTIEEKTFRHIGPASLTAGNRFDADATSASASLLSFISSLVINVVDDATSETDAIELDRNELPSPEGAVEKKEPMESGGTASPSPKADETDAIEADENKLPSPEGK